MILKDRNGNHGAISAYYEPPVFGEEWAATEFKDRQFKAQYASFIAVFGEPMIYRHPDLTPLVKIDDYGTNEPPMIPAFIANMTDEERKTFVAQFNSAKVTSVESIGENGALVGYELRLHKDVPPLDMTPSERASFHLVDGRPWRGKR